VEVLIATVEHGGKCCHTLETCIKSSPIFLVTCSITQNVIILVDHSFFEEWETAVGVENSFAKFYCLHSYSLQWKVQFGVYFED
jgi:hypothetical protein